MESPASVYFFRRINQLLTFTIAFIPPPLRLLPAFPRLQGKSPEKCAGRQFALSLQLKFFNSNRVSARGHHHTPLPCFKNAPGGPVPGAGAQA